MPPAGFELWIVQPRSLVTVTNTLGRLLMWGSCGGYLLGCDAIYFGRKVCRRFGRTLALCFESKSDAEPLG